MIDFSRALRSERAVWVALVLTSGVIGFGIGNGHTTQAAIQGLQNQIVQDRHTQVKNERRGERESLGTVTK